MVLFLTWLALLQIAQTPVEKAPSPLARVPTLQRLEKTYLERVHADVAALAKQRKTLEPRLPWRDWRCILHCHGYLSHDSRGTIAEIAAAAKQVGVDAIFMTDHPRAGQDVVKAGAHGVLDGVLFVPGSEADGFLVYPGDDKLPHLGVGEQPLADSVRRSGGMIFVAHPEEHTDWKLTGLTGMEIYNTHADFKDEAALTAVLQPRDSAGYTRLLKILNNIQAYPREAFAALFDPPTDNLARYDALCKERLVTAIAGNDSHQNVGFIVKGTEDGKYPERLSIP